MINWIFLSEFERKSFHIVLYNTLLKKIFAKGLTIEEYFLFLPFIIF